MSQSEAGPPPATEIEDVPLLRALGNRRSIRYFDESQTVERWKLEAMLQAARFASCQGNINCTEAIVVRRDECDVWDELEECVSGFNVQIINQASHLIIWLTNLNAWLMIWTLKPETHSSSSSHTSHSSRRTMIASVQLMLPWHDAKRAACNIVSIFQGSTVCASSKYRMLRRLPSARSTGTSGISAAGGGPACTSAIDALPQVAYTVIPR